MDTEKALQKLSANTVEIIPKNGLADKLDLAKKANRPLKIKLGLDPTSPDIHLGHVVALKKLRQFQDLGHEVILIVGDYTTKIGDPSGRSKTRPILSDEEIKKNAATYAEQARKILSGKEKIVYNSKWMSKLTAADIIKLLSSMTLAQITTREDFAKRIGDNIPIFMHELFYPFVQGYDSVALEADVEIGGTDQTFNMLAGRDVQKFYGQNQQVVITMPLLVGLDGVNKMSKSLGNYIGITDAPESMYGKIMSIPDALIGEYFKLCLDKQITDEAIKADPMGNKKELAFEIVEVYHSASDAKKAEEHFKKTVQDKEAPSEMEELMVAKGTKLIDILKQMEVAESNSEAGRLIDQGGVEINEEKIVDKNFIVEKNCIVKAGKRNYRKITIKWKNEF